MSNNIYDYIKSVIFTEKSSRALEGNKYSFAVLPSCNKLELKKAVESIFSVKVEKINIINLKGKVKRFKGVLGKRADKKKAIITLKEGETINYSKIS